MPKIVTAQDIAQWSGFPKVKYNCGDSLFLEQRSAGAAKTWIARIRVNGVVKEPRLGTLSEMPLEEARKLATMLREQALRGIYAPSLAAALDFLGLDELPDVSTFGGLATRYAVHQGAADASQRSARDAAWIGTLALKETHLWRLRMQNVTTSQALGVLRLQASRFGPESAARAQATIRAVANYALQHGFLRASAITELREPGWDDADQGVWLTGSAVSARQLGDALWRSRGTFSAAPVKLALKCLAMTVQPVDDVVAMRWDDLDLRSACWRMPQRPLARATPGSSGVVSTYGEKIVPLPVQLVAALRKLEPEHAYVFNRTKGDPTQHLVVTTIFTYMRDSLGLRSMFAPGAWPRAFQGWAECESARRAAPVEDAGCMDYILKRAHVTLASVGGNEDGSRVILQAWADELTVLESCAARAANQVPSVPPEDHVRTA